MSWVRSLTSVERDDDYTLLYTGAMEEVVATAVFGRMGFAIKPDP
jgi:hypothetical protein